MISDASIVGIISEAFDVEPVENAREAADLIQEFVRGMSTAQQFREMGRVLASFAKFVSNIEVSSLDCHIYSSFSITTVNGVTSLNGGTLRKWEREAYAEVPTLLQSLNDAQAHAAYQFFDWMASCWKWEQNEEVRQCIRFWSGVISSRK